MDYFTVRVTGDYSVDWDATTAELKFDSGDRFTMSKDEYKNVLRNMKMKIKFSDIDEIIQKKANVTQVKTKTGNSITVNSKHGMRLFRFLNGGNDEFDSLHNNPGSHLQVRKAV